jgi:hypothetical protein
MYFLSRILRDNHMDLYASAALTGIGHALAQQREPLRMEGLPDARETPSMDNMYASDHWSTVRGDERTRGTERWNAAQQPWKSGVVPKPAYASMFAAPEAPSAPTIQTLAGEQVTREDFTHNNMQPFFKGSVRQNTDPEANSSRLERLTGRSDLMQRKQEVQCFFEPTTGFANICGMPNNNDYYAEHIQAPRARNNDFPIEQVRVGPGLGQGFTASGAGGFQQSATLDYVRPKNVDELRVANKPKLSYEIPVQGPAKGIAQRGMLGEVEKNRPDTYYEQSSDMWLRTTGANTKETGRPVVDLKPTSRVEGHVPYQGVAQDTRAGKGERDDYGKGSIMVYDNERQVTQTRTVISNLTSTVKAVIAPFLDIVRRTPKEYTVDAPRVYGNMHAQIPSKPTTYDPVNHMMRVTIKETTIHDTNVANLKGPEAGTVPNMDSAKPTVRQTMPLEDTTRNVSSHTYRVTVYNADAAKKTVRETMRNNPSMFGFVGGDITETVGAYTHIDVQVPNTQKQFVSDYEYEGAAESKTDFRPRDRTAEGNAEIDGTREAMNIAAGHTPNGGGSYESLPPESVDMVTKKLVADSMAARNTGNVTRVMQYGAAPIEHCEVTKPAGPLLNGQENRLDPSVLSALSANPYNLSINPISA